MPWFKQKQVESSQSERQIKVKTNFPYWTFVHTEDSWFLLKDTTRLRITSQRILDSWAVSLVEVTEAAIKHYPCTGKLGFRDGTLINNIGDGKIYLVSKNKRRQITSPDAFDKYGLDQSKMIWVSADEAKLQQVGEELT